MPVCYGNQEFGFI